MIYDGLWFSPIFNSLMAFVDSTQENVSGEIKLQLYKGNITILSRTSPFSLYNKELATYGVGDTFSHQDSVGFINLVGLPFKTISRVINKNKLELNEHAVGK
jgi:argininosuccinate synthase